VFQCRAGRRIIRFGPQLYCTAQRSWIKRVRILVAVHLLTERNDMVENTKRANSGKTASSDGRLWKWGAGAAAAGAAIGGLALVNRAQAKRAERDNPPLGKFLTVDGVKLHYLERGEGAPVVLLHGNGTMIEDWIVSGALDELAKTHRVIAFDRPGFGHSERPRSRIWTPAAQAALIAAALGKLGIEKPLVVGHSFGTMVAAALALDHPESLSGLVLLGGYYFPSARADVLLASQPAIPGAGDVMRYTVSPLIGAAMLPRINARIFHPAPVPERWDREFPFGMTLRPSQIRAEAAEAGMMVPAAAVLAPRLGQIAVPVTIVAGTGDALVNTQAQSERLNEALPQSRFVAVEGAGHMIHHSARDEVLKAIRGR
jgi:pimeloyl-ACP methyl ester carboxylesterase